MNQRIIPTLACNAALLSLLAFWPQGFSQAQTAGASDAPSRLICQIGNVVNGSLQNVQTVESPINASGDTLVEFSSDTLPPGLAAGAILIVDQLTLFFEANLQGEKLAAETITVDPFSNLTFSLGEQRLRMDCETRP